MAAQNSKTDHDTTNRQQKSAKINLRLSEDLLNDLKKTADKKGMPYQRLIRELLREGLQK